MLVFKAEDPENQSIEFCGVNGPSCIDMLFEEFVISFLSCLAQTVESGFKGNENMARQGIGGCRPASM